jgi:adenosylhomocysteine nucleosidase
MPSGLEVSPVSRGPIGILCALPAELELLAAALRASRVVPGAALEARRGELDGHDVVVAAAGVGKVRAATTATLLAERLSCRALILSGVAGGLAGDLGIGELVIATRLIDIDYGRITDAGRILYQPGTLPLPGVVPPPGYAMPSRLEERVRDRLAEAGLRARLGTVLCGDAFLASATVRDELRAAWSALAIEMEGSAVCGVAERFDIPWLVVRAVSDRAGDEAVVDFAAFLPRAAASAAELVRALLPALSPA